MATGKQGCGSAAGLQHLVHAQREKEMHVQAPLTAMYIQAVPALPSHSQAQPAAMPDAAVLPLTVPVMLANQTLPILTLHITGGTALQQQKPELPSILASSPRPKSSGKHVCPHCGRDCLKPSVLEKHIRCHTGERPYPCPTCGISFKTQSNLYKHKRTQAHARLSSESGKETFSSQESTDSSRDFCFSSPVELQMEDSVDSKRHDSVLSTASSDQVCSAVSETKSDTEWALCKAAVVGLIASPAHGQADMLTPGDNRLSLSSEGKTEAALMQTKSPSRDARSPMTPNRTPLQRQEAVLPKLSRGKSQSHGSTDSGFSEIHDHHSTSSFGDNLHHPSLDSAPSMDPQKPGDSESPTDEATNKVSFQEKQKLEEHILKLISQNNLLMDDKHLLNVRPRKTVLSKQGSIDLPMPYTYKDSFHFEMRSSKHQVSISQTQDRRGRAIYSSMPTQHSTSMEHAPLTRSSSLPFSINNYNSDKTMLPNKGDNTLNRRCSSGHIHPFKSVDQHAPSHRSLVRQVAVDCLSTAEGSSIGSVEDFTDNGTDVAVKRCHRKKAQKFPYNKWYMYGGGTFKKLYNTEKDSSTSKSRKVSVCSEQTEIKLNQTSQEKDGSSMSESNSSCSNVCLPTAVNMQSANTASQAISSYVLLQSPVKHTDRPFLQHLANQTSVSGSCDLNTMTNTNNGTKEKDTGSEIHVSSQVPSERKKPKTDGGITAVVGHQDKQIGKEQCFASTSQQENANLCQSPSFLLSDLPKRTLSIQEKDKDGSFTRQPFFKPRQLFKRHSSPLFVANVSGTSGSTSASASISSISVTETSFLPKYQLKIPSSTDGVAKPCFGKASSPIQQTHPATTPAPSVATSSAWFSTAITQTDLVPMMECIVQCQPSIYTSAPLSTSPTILSQFPQNKPGSMLTQNQCATHLVHSMSPSPSSTVTKPGQTSPARDRCHSGTVSSRHDIIPSLCQSTTNSKNSSGSTMSVLQKNSAMPVLIERQSPAPNKETPVSGSKTLMGGIPLDLIHTAFPEAKDIFYVQTADLQIVMQLISDEQLAQIEPHIETPGYTSTRSHTFFSKDMDKPENESKIQKIVFDNRHTLCSEDTGLKERSVAFESKTTSLLSQFSDLTHRGVISSSCSKPEHLNLTSLDSQAKILQCQDTISTAPEGSIVLASTGHRIPTYPAQRPSKKQNDASLDRSETKSSPELGSLSTGDQISGVFINIKTSVKGIHSPNISSVSEQSEPSSRHENHRSVVMTPQKQKSQLVSGTFTSDKGEITQAKMSCISETPKRKPASVSTTTTQPKLVSSEEPSHWSPHSSLGTSALYSQSKRLNCTCEKQNLNNEAQQNKTCTHHLYEWEYSTVGAQICSDQPQDDQELTPETQVHLTPDCFESDRPKAKSTKKESVECKQVPGGLCNVGQDTFTRPPVSASLQSPELQRIAGTESWRWTPQEDKEIGGDSGVEMLDINFRHVKEEEDGMKNKEEEVTCSFKGYDTTLKPHLQPSRHETDVNVKPSSSQLGLSTVSIITTPAIGEATNHPQDSPPVSQSEFPHNSEQVDPKLTSQNHTNEFKHVSVGSHEKLFISSPARTNEARHMKCGHLLAHPLLVNAIQTEVEKEKMNPESGYSRRLQILRPLLDQEKNDETLRFDVSEELFMTSFCNTETSQITKDTLDVTFTSCTMSANKSGINSDLTCTSHIKTELNAPQCQPGDSYLEEEERSSSDDEGKLVINLE